MYYVAFSVAFHLVFVHAFEWYNPFSCEGILWTAHLKFRKTWDAFLADRYSLCQWLWVKVKLHQHTTPALLSWIHEHDVGIVILIVNSLLQDFNVLIKAK